MAKSKKWASHQCPDEMISIQGFPHHRQVWVKKFVQESRIHLETWNKRTLTSKSIELEVGLKRMRVNIVCLQETKWKGKKAKKIDCFKLWYIGEANNINGIRIIVNKNL